MKQENLFNLSMFLVRVIIGVIFVGHGAQKLFGMFDGVGLEGTAKIVEGLGMSDAYIIAMIWGAIEFFGGIFLIFGISARWAAVLIVLTMIVRLWKVNLVYGSFIENGGIEQNLIVVAACLPIILVGGGRWSVWDI